MGLRRHVYIEGLLLGTFVLLLIAPDVSYGRKQLSPSGQELSLKPKSASVASRSVNLPWDGSLVRGLAVRESKVLRHLPECAKDHRFYGTWQLVQLVQRAALHVARRFSGAQLTIGELSGRQGGDINGHRSHESGRDADVGFYIQNSDGSPRLSAEKFVEFDHNGRGLAPNGGLRFDAARNWELVSKLISDDDARVQFVFVARGLQQLLLKAAVRRKASPELIGRATSVMVEPTHGNPHRSHFHVRIYCPPTDRPLCRDVSPYWPWYPGTPEHNVPPLGVLPVNELTKM
jgi:penicillin-insensitive murein endopeptidase